MGYWTVYDGDVDVFVLAALSVFRQWDLLVEHIDATLLEKLARLAGSGSLALVLAIMIVQRVAMAREKRWDGPGKILLFPSRTTHSRIFPKKHSFSYSYLVVGVPVNWEGTAGGIVSVGTNNGGLFSWLSKGWYTIDPGDYLDRGRAELGLRGKLDAYLQDQGADPASYPHAYLVTAARFLGYHFNPVSFWYLYDADKALAAMVLEVNNTFGERRMYFLTPDDDPSKQITSDGLSAKERQTPPRTTMKQSWPKDFHVSPFNSRKGGYSLVASDPLSPGMQGRGPVVNTINLVSSKGHGKLVARLVPEGSAIDPDAMSLFDKLKFLASWWWVGFLTFPRIVKEAGVLFFRRKLHVWFRPEPLKQSIGRQADSTERRLEPLFRKYLQHLVVQSTTPLAVKYIPSGVPDGTSELMLSSAAKDGAPAEEVEFKVLTPVFYSRFVHYAHDLEAFSCELQENCTIWVSRPDLLPKFALRKPLPVLATSSYVDFAYFKLIQKLRTRPERIERPLTSSASLAGKPVPADDIRGFRISPMDGYVLAHETGPAKAVYRSSVLKLFLADKIALGLIPLLDTQRLILQTWFAWHLSTALGRVLAALTLALRKQVVG
ncbi:hypothetical protein OQA88_10508 [Cercophora sp. LCS_1]